MAPVLSANTDVDNLKIIRTMKWCRHTHTQTHSTNTFPDRYATNFFRCGANKLKTNIVDSLNVNVDVYATSRARWGSNSSDSHKIQLKKCSMNMTRARWAELNEEEHEWSSKRDSQAEKDIQTDIKREGEREREQGKVKETGRQTTSWIQARRPTVQVNCGVKKVNSIIDSIFKM